MRYFAECRRIKTLRTCIAARSLLSLEETQQARQNLGAVQDRSRLGGSQEDYIDINDLPNPVSNNASTVLFIRRYFPVWHRTVPSSILVRVYLASLRKT